MIFGIHCRWAYAIRPYEYGRIAYAPYRIRPMPKIISAAIPNARSTVPHPRFAAHHPIPSSHPFPAPRTPHPNRQTACRNGIRDRTVPRDFIPGLPSPADLTACQSPHSCWIWGDDSTAGQPVRAEGLGSPESERSDTLGCFDAALFRCRNVSMPR